MFDFLKALWSSSTPVARKPQKPRGVRLGVEAFESRDVPSASGFGHFAPHAFFGSFAASQSSVPHGARAATQVFSASLTSDNGASGKVTFTLNTSASTNSLTLTATGLTANATFDVQVGGTSVGSVTADANGAANTTLKNISSTVAATIAAGTAFALVDTSTDPATTALSGTFAKGGGGCRHDSGPRYSATLTGATGTSGSAFAHTDTTAGTSSLKVKVAGLTASTDYVIQLDGTKVGTITTDASGAGSTKLTGLTNTITAGTSVLTVLDASGATVLTGTLNAATGHGHGRR